MDAHAPRATEDRGCDGMSPRQILGGSGESYIVRWAQEALQPDSVKATLTGIAVVVEAVIGIFDVLFFAVLGLWALDFAAGILRVLKTDEEPSLSRALDGVLKLLIYVIVLATCAFAGVIVMETTGWDPTRYFLSGAYAVLAWSEINSISENVAAAHPPFARALRKVLQFAPRKDR